MNQQAQSPKLPGGGGHRRKAEPPWLWLALIVGSAAIHAGVAIVAVPWLGRISSPAATFSAVPVGLIDLPPEAPSASTENPSALAAIAASRQTPARPNTPASSPSANASPAALPRLSQPAASATPAAPSAMTSRSSSPAANPSAQAEVQTATATPSPANSAATVPTAQPNPATPAGTATAAGASPGPSPTTAATPGFATIPIDVPTPDVSETLPIRPIPQSPSPLAQVEVNRENTPVRLTVSLELEQVADEIGDDPDRLAAPSDGVTNREISTVSESACAGTLKPEIMQSLGVKVGLQVSTDATGQVTQIAAQVPSRNPAYNELARCLVQHWGFAPAEDGGDPVPSNALLVWVTIDRT